MQKMYRAADERKEYGRMDGASKGYEREGSQIGIYVTGKDEYGDRVRR